MNVVDKIEKIDNRVEKPIVWVVFSILVFGTLILTKTINSGFHLVDDWEFMKYMHHMDICGENFWQCLSFVLKEDLQLRFRPLYYIIRVTWSCIFGYNLFVYSIVRGVEIILALGFLYLDACLAGSKRVYAFLFSLTVMIGEQSVVWWKLGPQEAWGTVLFALGFYFLLRYLNSEKKGFAIASVIVVFLMATYKESYILMIPFLMLYVIYDGIKDRVYDTLSWKILFDEIKKKRMIEISFLTILVLFLGIIVFFIGTNNYDYVGLDGALKIENYREIWGRNIKSDLKWYARFSVLYAAILLTLWDYLKEKWMEFILCLSITLPQIVLYSKTGLDERYVLPAIIGFALFFVVYIANWDRLFGIRRYVYIVCIVLSICAYYRVAIREADYFAYRGRSVQGMLDIALDKMQEDSNTRILSCLAPNYEGNDTLFYWLEMHGYQNLWCYYNATDTTRLWTEETGTCQTWGDDDSYSSNVVDDFDVLIAYNKEDRHWTYDLDFDLSEFDVIDTGTIYVYVRNK